MAKGKVTTNLFVHTIYFKPFWLLKTTFGNKSFLMLGLVGLTRLIFLFIFFLFHLFLSIVFCHFMSKIVFEVVMICYKRQCNKLKLSKQQQPTIYSLQHIEKHTQNWRWNKLNLAKKKLLNELSSQKMLLNTMFLQGRARDQDYSWSGVRLTNPKTPKQTDEWLAYTDKSKEHYDCLDIKATN